MYTLTFSTINSTGGFRNRFGQRSRVWKQNTTNEFRPRSRNITEPSAVAPGQTHSTEPSLKLTRRYRARFCASSLHKPFRISQRNKPALAIKIVRVARHEYPATQA